jgi:hypothetical protein
MDGSTPLYLAVAGDPHMEALLAHAPVTRTRTTTRRLGRRLAEIEMEVDVKKSGGFLQK